MLDMKNAMMELRNLEKEYVRTKHAFTSDYDRISTCWLKTYSAINHIITIQNYDAERYCCYQEYCEVYLALVYFTISEYWNNVPYKTKDNINGFSYIPCSSNEAICDSIQKNLTKFLPNLTEKRNDAFTDANSMFFVSKDVARFILGYSHIAQKEYDQALPYLSQIIENGYYRLDDSPAATYSKNSECILGFVHSENNQDVYIPSLDYKDLLLTVAECHYHTGNSAKAEEIVKEICSKKSLTANGNSIIEKIASLKQQIESPFYIPFIRRNNLGESILKLSADEVYQLLFPIPSSEIDFNPTITQNPGY